MMKDVMVQIFGTYAPIDGCTDWGYIAGVVIFGICLYSFFRILALAIKR